MEEYKENVSAVPSYGQFLDKSTNLFNKKYVFNAFTIDYHCKKGPFDYKIKVFVSKFTDPFLRHRIELFNKKYGLSFKEITSGKVVKFITNASASFPLGLKIETNYTLYPYRKDNFHDFALNFIYGCKFLNYSSRLHIAKHFLKAEHSLTFSYKNFLTGYHIQIDHRLYKIDFHSLLFGYKIGDYLLSANLIHEPIYTLTAGPKPISIKDQYFIECLIRKNDLFLQDLDVGFQFKDSTDERIKRLYQLAAKYKFNNNYKLHARFNNNRRLDLGFERKWKDFSIVFCVGTSWELLRNGMVSIGGKLELR